MLGRPRGIRIAEAPDRDGQYFHYLAMWLYALAVLGRHIPDYARKGMEFVRQIHDAFVVPGCRNTANQVHFGGRCCRYGGTQGET